VCAKKNDPTAATREELEQHAQGELSLKRTEAPVPIWATERKVCMVRGDYEKCTPIVHAN